MKRLLLKSEKSILLMFLLIVTSLTRGQSTQTYTSNGSFVTPAGVTTVKAEAYGAGGGGGYGGTANKQGGGGGGGAGYSVNTSATVAAQASYTITVGTPGVGGTTSGTNGTTGGNTTATFASSTVTATGGLGGKAYSTGGNGGGGGNGTKNGGNGANGTTSGSGGGGGAGGGTSNGGAGSIPTGGTSGGLLGGIGGAGSSSNSAAGTTGGNYGGGGGGGTKSSTGANGGNGYMIITYTCPTYGLTSTTSTDRCGAGTTTIALSASAASLPTGNYIVTYDLSGANSSTGNTANMTVTTAGSGTFTTSSLSTGSTTIKITNLASSYCSTAISTGNSDTITVAAIPDATAGANIATCSNAGAVNISTGASAINASGGITWTSSGTGTFSNQNSIVSCTYDPSPADILAGSVTITLTATGTAPCTTDSSSKTLTISNPMTVVAGSTINTCANVGAVTITTGSNATNYTTVTWTSNGSGAFSNPNSLTSCTYTPSAADIAAGSVILTLTATNAGCTTVSANRTLKINPAPVAVAGTPVSGCILGGSVNITAGASASNYTSVNWTSSGLGSFTNSNSLTTCTYTPSAADIALGTVTLSLTVYGNATCINATSTKTLTIRTPIVASSGSNVTTCATTGAVNITTGATSLNQTSVEWTSNGSGVFTNSNNLTTCTYTPSAADIAAGSVSITLTASNGGCADVVSTKTLTILPAATAVAGTAINTCSTSGAVNITAGASATNYSSVTWTSNGTGTFTNAGSLTLCTYTPSAADITAGTRTLTLTVNGNSPCGSITATKSINISKAMTVVAGSNANICSSTASVNVSSGASATNQTGVTWTSSGTGVFTNPNSLGACTYAPSAADITAGSVTITLTATNNSCPAVTSSKVLTIFAAPLPVAGTAIATCSTSGAVNITAGSSAANATTTAWTSSGTGTFANASSLTTCTYNPSAADITAGSVTLTLTASNAGCTSVTSTKVLTINRLATVNAGTAIYMCNAAGANITTGATATNYASVAWTSDGTGTFTNANSLTTAFYSPSAADIAAGSVNVTLTAYGNAPCADLTSTKLVTITSPTATAGTAISTCASAGAVNITAGASATNYTTVTWTSSGTGTFTNPNSLTLCTYTPSAADKTAGTVTLTLTATAPGCSNDTSVKTLTISAAATITGTTPGSRSGSGTVLLGATASAGTIYWYAASTGGSALGFGTNFTTPSISVTTTYYVEVVNGSCTSSPRVAVIATVNQPEIDILGNAVSIADGSTVPTTANWTDFGATTATRTFTIKNTGVGVLTVGAITIAGANASDFSVTTSPSSSIASGSSSTFTIAFNPTAAGVRSASIAIVNSDSDENPYDFNIQGTGVAREIDIKGNGVTIVDGSTTATTTNWTDFGSVTATRTFTIYNTGNVVLNLGAITMTGANASDFVVTTPPAATVAAYASTTFTVTFTPSAILDRYATIAIANDDSDENPYDFALHGYGVIPEIDIQGNAVSIADGTTATSTANWTDFSTTTVTRTFTILNQGNTNLTIGAITFTGTNASDFSITSAPSATVSAFGSTTFTVTFNPGGTGTRTAKINIVNNDSNENPYDFNLQATGLAQEIDLQGNGVSIVDGDTTPSAADWTDFGTAAAVRTFTILNQGNMPLNITGVTFTGTNAADFSVTTAPASVVPAFSSTTFTVTFNNSGTGNRTATMNIGNNDSNENPYDVAIQATGGTKIITVSNQNNLAISDGDTTPTSTKMTDFGSVSINSGSVTVTYTIKNTGTGAISLGATSFTGANAADFTVTLAPAAALAPNATTNFEISFNPSTKGIKNATFAIVTNATGMNPFDFVLTGLGVQTYIDTDGDGVTDNMDLDDDNDGIKDVKEQSDAIAYPLSNFVKYTFLNETFGAGKTKGKININTPGASTTSCYEDNITANANSCGSNSSGVLDDGEYVVNYIITNTNGVSSDPENIHHDLAWTDQRDHTGDTDGRMAIFNADNTAGTYFYQLIINGVLPNTVTSFNFWVMNLMRRDNLGSTILPNITVEFRDITGATLIASYNTGDIGRCSATNSADNSCGQTLSNWLNYSTSVNLGNVTDFMIKIRNNAPGGGGNDFAMDDIVITQNYVDTDGDGIANIFDLDDENDGIPDIEEAGLKAYSSGTSKMDLSSSATWVDANANGLNDKVESLITSGTYLVADTDGDGVPNYLDLDSDNDSFFDVDEANLLNGDGDINGDGKGDLLDTDKDGILDLYDNSTGFGTTARAYAQDTDGDGIPDYLDLDKGGVKDITTGLYSILDANNDGMIDGSTDIDKDGILDTFDTNTLVIGSPRDLNRKLLLDFDGRNDYAESTGVLSGYANATLMAWIDLNSTFSATGVVVGQDKFNIRITSAKTLQATLNGTTVTYGTALSTARWYHVAATYGGGSLKLYLNGTLVATQSLSGAIATDATKLTLGREPSGASNYFKGKIDEVRVFGATLTAVQVQRMVYQEIQNTASQVRGAIVPKDVGSLPFTNVLRYYRMDAYKDDIVDDLTTASIDTGTGMKMYNHKNIYVQQAPMPFTTVRTGTFATAIDDTTKDIRGLDILDYDYSIVQAKHNVTETANTTQLALFVDPAVTVSMTNDTKLQNDWYLKLNGKIDLVGKSQLIQTANSDLEATSTGSLERDQQGQSNKFNYNYWSSPVSSINGTTINHGWTVAGVMKDGTDPNNIQNLQWTTGVNGSPTSPITLSSYWIFKFQNSSNSYANWASVGQNGTLLPGQGFTMKGAGAATADQNYTFVGKPNNGVITSTVGAGNLNLCGNPYPSAIDANQFIDDNASSIKGTLYIWQHYSTNNSHNTIQYQGGYATYTKTGGTTPVAPAGVSGLGSSSKTPMRFIPVGQGFFVTGSATGGTITFNNGQRLFIKEDDAANSYTMFKNNNPTVAAQSNPLMNNEEDDFVEEQFMKVRLGYTSSDNYHRQTLLGFMNEHATAGYDNGYDGISIETLTNDMYFINGEDKLNISGDGFFNVNNIYPVGVKNATSGNVTFQVDGKENFEDSQEIYIYDNVDNIYHSIKSENYVVNLPAGTYDGRFSLRFTDGTNLGTVDHDANHGITVNHSQADSMINIKNELMQVTVKSVAMFNLLGQKVTEWNISNQDQANIKLPVSGVATGTYIVKVLTDGGEITKKILVKN